VPLNANLTYKANSSATKGLNSSSGTPMQVDQDYPLDLAAEIRDAVHGLMAEAIDPQKFKTLKAVKAPMVLKLAIRHLMNHFASRHSWRKSTGVGHQERLQEAFARYQELFPAGKCTFKFPRNLGTTPSAAYHQIESTTSIYLDWTISHPNMRLDCPKCVANRAPGGLINPNSFLLSLRTNFLKDKQLCPIWQSNGTPIFCVAMQYKCQACQKTTLANDGPLLALLPHHVAETYPVPIDTASETSTYTMALSTNWNP